MCIHINIVKRSSSHSAANRSRLARSRTISDLRRDFLVKYELCTAIREYDRVWYNVYSRNTFPKLYSCSLAFTAIRFVHKLRYKFIYISIPLPAYGVCTEGSTSYWDAPTTTELWRCRNPTLFETSLEFTEQYHAPYLKLQNLIPPHYECLTFSMLARC